MVINQKNNARFAVKARIACLMALMACGQAVVCSRPQTLPFARKVGSFVTKNYTGLSLLSTTLWALPTFRWAKLPLQITAQIGLPLATGAILANQKHDKVYKKISNRLYPGILATSYITSVPYVGQLAQQFGPTKKLYARTARNCHRTMLRKYGYKLPTSLGKLGRFSSRISPRVFQAVLFLECLRYGHKNWPKIKRFTKKGMKRKWRKR